MRRWRLRLGAAVLLLAGMAGPGMAGEPSLARVFTPGCRPDFTSAALAEAGAGGKRLPGAGLAGAGTEAGADGRIRGFVEVNGDGCDPDERVWFVEGAGAAWARPEATPYRGVVLAAAEDAGDTWLLYQGLSGVFLGRRTGPGVYVRPRVVSTFSRPQVAVPGGDLVVGGGRWWAVWSEQVGAGAAGSPAQAELFEAGTLAGGRVAKRAVTAHPYGDVEPSLAFERDRGVLRLAWVRRAPGALVSELRVAHARAGERWTSRVVSQAGTLNLDPTLAIGAGGEGAGEGDREGVVLAWQQDLRVVVSAQGSAPVVVSSGPGVRPHVIVVEDGGVRVGWTEPGARGRAVVAEPEGGDVWVERAVAPELDADQTLAGLRGNRIGAGTALVMTERGELYALATPEPGTR